MEDEILRTALAPGAPCLSLEQLGRYADGTLGAEEQSAADMHIRALSQLPGGARAAGRGDVRAPSATAKQTSSATAWRVCSNRRRRSSRRSRGTIITASMVSFRQASCRRRGRSLADGDRHWQLLLPSDAEGTELPGSVTTGDEVTRSLAVTVRGPIGDQVGVAATVRMARCRSGRRYRVRLMEVDRQRGLVRLHIGARSGGAGVDSSVDRSRQNVALGRDGVRRGGRGDCRIGDAILQGRAEGDPHVAIQNV